MKGGELSGSNRSGIGVRQILLWAAAEKAGGIMAILRKQFVRLAGMVRGIILAQYIRCEMWEAQFIVGAVISALRRGRIERAGSRIHIQLCRRSCD